MPINLLKLYKYLFYLNKDKIKYKLYYYLLYSYEYYIQLSRGFCKSEFTSLLQVDHYNIHTLWREESYQKHHFLPLCLLPLTSFWQTLSKSHVADRLKENYLTCYPDFGSPGICLLLGFSLSGRCIPGKVKSE